MTKIQQATLPAPRAYIIYAARSWAGGGQKSPITALILSKPALFKGLAKSVLTESGCPNVGRGRPDGSHGCPDAGDGRPNAGHGCPDGGNGRSNAGRGRPDVGGGRPNALHGRLFAAENGFTPALTTAMVGTVRCAVRIAERSVRRCLPERTKTFRPPRPFRPRSAVRRFPGCRRTARPCRWPMGECASGDIAARCPYQLPPFRAFPDWFRGNQQQQHTIDRN